MTDIVDRLRAAGQTAWAAAGDAAMAAGDAAIAAGDAAMAAGDAAEEIKLLRAAVATQQAELDVLRDEGERLRITIDNLRICLAAAAAESTTTTPEQA